MDFSAVHFMEMSIINFSDYQYCGYQDQNLKLTSQQSKSLSNYHKQRKIIVADLNMYSNRSAKKAKITGNIIISHLNFLFSKINTNDIDK